MHHCGTKSITTSRLVLRPLTIDDAEMMFNNWANDPEVTRYLRWPPHRSWPESAEILNEWSKHYIDPGFYQWGITERKTGILFGSMSVFKAAPNAGWRFDAAPLGEAWEAGYCIGRKWWGRGLATEALCAVRDYWFTGTDSPWLTCLHDIENVASGAVMQKAGFRYDHDATDHKFDGTAVPCRVYFITREDWNELQRAEQCENAGPDAGNNA